MAFSLGGLASGLVSGYDLSQKWKQQSLEQARLKNQDDATAAWGKTLASLNITGAPSTTPPADGAPADGAPPITPYSYAAAGPATGGVEMPPAMAMAQAAQPPAINPPAQNYNMPPPATPYGGLRPNTQPSAAYSPPLEVNGQMPGMPAQGASVSPYGGLRPNMQNPQQMAVSGQMPAMPPQGANVGPQSFGGGIAAPAQMPAWNQPAPPPQSASVLAKMQSGQPTNISEHVGVHSLPDLIAAIRAANKDIDFSKPEGARVMAAAVEQGMFVLNAQSKAAAQEVLNQFRAENLDLRERSLESSDKYRGANMDLRRQMEDRKAQESQARLAQSAQRVDMLRQKMDFAKTTQEKNEAYKMWKAATDEHLRLYDAASRATMAGDTDAAKKIKEEQSKQVIPEKPRNEDASAKPPTAQGLPPGIDKTEVIRQSKQMIADGADPDAIIKFIEDKYGVTLLPSELK